MTDLIVEMLNNQCEAGGHDQEIRDALQHLLAPKQVTEMRILNTPRGTVSGYFDDPAKLAAAAARLSGKVSSVYAMLNPVNPALLARAHNRLGEHAKHTTSDSDILRRHWLLLDFDPVRPAGVSSTDAEHAAAIQRARDCVTWLRALGITAGILADSGNGGHILVRIDLPNDAASTILVRKCIESVALRFSDDAVVVDLSVYNAARIWKVYGTLACKGDSTSDRPHRLARMLDVPDELAPTPRELLEKLAALAPEEPKAEQRQSYTGYGAFDLGRWIAGHGLDVRGPYPWQGGQKWVFQTCPWNSDHTNRSAVIVQHAGGGIAAKCHHNGCAGKDWHDLRNIVEPGWREKRRHNDEERRLMLTKLSDLLNEPEEKVAWLVDKLLPSGGFSLLVAKPKAGKSTLARNLSLAVSPGKTFLGRATQKGPVIYLALEEKRAEVRKHFQDMGATGTEDIYIHAASAPGDALQQIRAVAEEKKPVLIIIDPLFRLTRVKDGNDYAQVTKALEPLLVLARETGAHVLCVHHLGKGERRDESDGILGSTAIFAAVDTALIMKRTDRYRTISSIQRYGEDLPETVLRFDPQTRTVTLGEGREQEEGNRIAEAIIACLKVQEEDKEKGHALTQAELEEEVEGKTVYKRKALKALVDGKQVERIGKGSKGDPFRYALPNSCFLVPSIYEEQGNKNRKNGTTPQEDSPNACSRDSDGVADSAKTREQANPPSWRELYAKSLEPGDAGVIE